MHSLIEREMAITWEEFLRTLPAAVGERPYALGERQAIVEFEPGECFTLTLGPTGERRIGALSLPATPARIEYAGQHGDRFRVFLERFDRYFQRGGG